MTLILLLLLLLMLLLSPPALRDGAIPTYPPSSDQISIKPDRIRTA